MKRRLAIFAVGLSLLAAGSASAQSGFQMPSKNVYCKYFAIDGPPGTLRCDMMQVDVPPRAPFPCEGDYGRAFEMTDFIFGFLPDLSPWQPSHDSIGAFPK